MKNSDELRDELSGSPFLKKMKEQPGSGGFQVPKHYFKHLPDEVMRQVKQPAPAPVPTSPSWWEQFVLGLFQPRYALAFASVLVLVVAGWFFFAKNGTDAPQPVAVRLEDIPDEELLAYVSDNIGDFDHGLVLEASGPELPEVTPQPKPTLPKTSVPKPKVEDMEEYLDEVIDEIDIEDLEELLQG